MQAIIRGDGRRIRVIQKRGQLFLCQQGCCCGRTEQGFAPAFADLHDQEWTRRKLRNVLHLTYTTCLGPCALANVALLILDGNVIWLHSLSTAQHVLALYDYIEAMLAAQRLLPPPEILREHIFENFLQNKLVQMPVAAYQNALIQVEMNGVQ